MTIARDLSYVAALVASSSANVVFDDTIVLNGGTANGVLYLNSNKVVTTGGALRFDGSKFRVAAPSGVNMEVYETSSGAFNRIVISQQNTVSTYNSTYSTGTGAHAWQIGNLEYMRLDSAGNLGIGTSSPEVRFHAVTSGNSSQFFFDSTSTSGSFGLALRSTAASGNAHPIFGITQWRTSFLGNTNVGQIRFDGLTTTGAYTTFAEIYATATGSNSSTGAATSLSFRTSDGTGQAQDRVIISSSGEIGIGSGVSPGVKLQLAGTQVNWRRFSTDNAPLYHVNIKCRGTASTPITVNSNDVIASYQFYAHDGTAERISSQIQGEVEGTPASGTVSGRLTFWTTPAGTSQFPIERMRITKDGFIGIGTGEPTTNIVVYHNVNPVSGNATNKGTIQICSNGDGSAGGGRGLEFKSSSASNGYGYMISSPDLLDGNVPLIFSSRTNSASWTERMRLNFNGQLLINSTAIASPTLGTIQLLQVAGGAITAGSSSSTDGTAIIYGYYGAGAITVFGSEYSTGGPVISYGMEPRNVVGGFKSTYGLGGALNRTAITVADSIKFFVSPATSAAIGNTVPVTQAMTLDVNGNLFSGGTLSTSCRWRLSQPNGDGALHVSGNGAQYGFIKTGVGHGSIDIGADSSIPLVFFTNNTDRARITNEGDLVVGNTVTLNTNAKFSVWNTAGAAKGIATGYSTTNGQFRLIYIRSSDDALAFDNGVNVATLTSAGAWTNSSDARKKTNITSIKYGLDTVLSTEPRSFNRVDVDGEYIGFIAQELKEKIPEVVYGNEENSYSVDYGSLVAVAFKAIQELKAQNDALLSRIEALESKLPE